MRISRHISGLLALVVAVFYTVGVFGFDVHRSEDTHRTYIIPLISGISCEHIHPECLCHHDHSHDHSACACGLPDCDCDGCEEGEDCCHDSIEVLDITGTDIAPVVLGPVFFAQILTVEEPVAFFDARQHSVLRRAFFTPPPPDLSLLHILRV